MYNKRRRIYQNRKNLRVSVTLYITNYVIWLRFLPKLAFFQWNSSDGHDINKLSAFKHHLGMAFPCYSPFIH